VRSNSFLSLVDSVFFHVGSARNPSITAHAFSATPCVKIVENHLGKAFLKMNFAGLTQQIQLVPVPAPAPVPAAPVPTPRAVAPPTPPAMPAAGQRVLSWARGLWERLWRRG
jgi:hypothetical protein